MFDNSRKNATGDDPEKTKPRHLSTAKIPPNPFDQILESADIEFDQKPKKLADDLPDWPLLIDDDSFAEIQNSEDGFKLPSSDMELRLLEEEDDLPVWLKEDNGDLFAHKGLPKADRNDLPDWMTEHNPDQLVPNIDLSEFRWKPAADVKKDKEEFNPNKTQKIKPVNRIESTPGQKEPPKTKISFINLDKYDKAFFAFVGIFLYAIAVNLAGSFIQTRFDEIVLNVAGYYLYMYFANKGYDLKNLLPPK